MPSSRESQLADSGAAPSSPGDEDRRLRACFGDWVNNYSKPLLRFALRMTGDQSAAEDLVQETFEQAWRSMRSLRDPTAAQAWLFRIMRTRFARWLKSHRRQAKLSIEVLTGELEPSMTSTPEDRLSDHDELQQALEQLDIRFKEPLLLVVLEELPVEQVSRILKLRRGTVLSRVHRGKQKLARIIEVSRQRTPPEQPPTQSGTEPTADSIQRDNHARTI